MPGTSNVASSGNQDVDGLLSGIKWAVTDLTYSFPSLGSYYDYSTTATSNNFNALNTVQEDTARSILEMYEDVSGLNFTEVTESDIVHGDLRFARSDDPGTAYAYYPSSGAWGGDSFYRNGTYDSPDQGTYAYATFAHEIGHAVGLKHGQETDVYGALPADHDSAEYSIMTYRSYVGSLGSYYSISEGDGSQTIMQDDIAALQYMYGANYNTNSTDNVYQWSASTGEMTIDGVGQGASTANSIFLTIWDGGGNDTYDYSNYSTDLSVDLSPGSWTTLSSDQLSHLGSGNYARGNISNALLYEGNVASLIENAIGGSGSDTITGNSANNTLTGNAGADIFTGGGGNDTIIGGGDIDTAIFSGALSEYTIISHNGETGVLTTGSDGRDMLTGVENLQFADQTVASTTATEFSGLEYIASYGDLTSIFGTNEQAAYDHFVNFGFSAGRSADIFDARLYIGAHSDVRAQVGNDEAAATLYFLTNGVNEGHANNDFLGLEYIASYGDLINAYGSNGAAGRAHFLDAGFDAGRATSFDGLEYIASYSDLTAVFGQNAEAGAAHFINFGSNAGRQTDLFDARIYIGSHDSVRASIGTDVNAAAEHYLTQGNSAGLARDAFSGLEYIASYTDLINAYGSNGAAGRAHFISMGFDAGRQLTFDGLEYIASHADLINVFGANAAAGANHYIQAGFNAGRTTSFDPQAYLDANPDVDSLVAGDLDAATLHYINIGFSDGLGII